MLNYRRLGILLMILVVGCGSEPQMNYDDDTIVKVLKDMLIAEGASTRMSIGQRDSINQFYYNQIFEIHQVDSLKFTNDLKTMGEDPVHSIRIYSRIEEVLEEDQVKAKANKKEKK